MAIYQDGLFPSGAPILTIGVTGYRCNNFQVDEDAAVVNINDNNGEHDGAVIFRGPVTGSAELQVATTASALATHVANSVTSGLFSYAYNGTTLTYMITKAGETRPAQGVWLQPISFMQKKN